MKKPPSATAAASGSDPDSNAVAALATTVVAACPPGLIRSDYTGASRQNHSDVATRPLGGQRQPLKPAKQELGSAAHLPLGPRPNHPHGHSDAESSRRGRAEALAALVKHGYSIT